MHANQFSGLLNQRKQTRVLPTERFMVSKRTLNEAIKKMCLWGILFIQGKQPGLC